jgi:shikimate kinase
LLPSFDLEECVEVIVSRQLQRNYLAADKEREEERIRARFPLFMALRCNRFLSKASPSKVAAELEAFYMANQPLNARPRAEHAAH